MTNRNIDRAPFGATPEVVAQPEYKNVKDKWYRAMPSPHNPNEISWLDIDSKLSDAERAYLEYTYLSVQTETPATTQTNQLWDAIQPKPQTVEAYSSVIEMSPAELLEEKRRVLEGLRGLVTPVEREIEYLEDVVQKSAEEEIEQKNQAAVLKHLQEKSGSIIFQSATPTVAALQMPPVVSQLQPDMSSYNLPVTDTDKTEDELTLKEKSKTKEKAPKTKMSRRRQLGTVAAIVAGAAVATGGGLALTGNTFGIGATDASVSPDKRAAVDPDTIPELSANTLIDAFGGCLDERGAGPALFSSLADVAVKVDYQYTDLNGAKYPIAARLESGEYFRPTTKLVETPIRWTACVEAANRAAVITEIDGDTLKIDLTKISPQVYVDAKTTTRTVPQIEGGFDAIVNKFVAAGTAGNKNGISVEEGARLKAAYIDEPNKNSEITQVRIRAAEILSDEAGVYAQQAMATAEKTIPVKINEVVAKLYEQGLSKYPSVNVVLDGKIDDSQAKDPALIKNPAAQPANAFTLDKASGEVTNFTVKVDGATK